MKLIIEQRGGWVYTMAWSPDSQTLAVAIHNSTKILIYDANTGQRNSEIWASKEPYHLEWSPDGELLAAATHLGISVWQVKTNVPKLLPNINRDPKVQRPYLAWSPDGKLLENASPAAISIWDVDSKNEKMRRRHQLEVQGPLGMIAYSPNGEQLAVVSANRIIQIWNLKTGRITNKLEDHKVPIMGMSFSFDGRFLVTKSEDAQALIWRCDTWEIIDILHEPTSETPQSLPVFHPDRMRLAKLGDQNSVIHIVDLDTKLLLSRRSNPFR